MTSCHPCLGKKIKKDCLILEPAVESFYMLYISVRLDPQMFLFMLQALYATLKHLNGTRENYDSRGRG